GRFRCRARSTRSNARAPGTHRSASSASSAPAAARSRDCWRRPEPPCWRATAEVAAACASRGATSSLEIAASEAMVVLADANLDGAVAGALWAAFAGAGQLHGSLQRVYVERELHDAFVDALAAAASSLRIGDPLESTTELG